MKRTWASSWSDLFRCVESPSGQRWSPGQLWTGHRLHCLYIKKSGAAWAARIVCAPLIQHNDIILRKLKAWWDFCNIFKVSPKSFQGGKNKKKNKRSSNQRRLYESPAFFHIFITIKWQFKQRNEYCILIGVICSRISCIIHTGGDHRWVTRRAAAADASEERVESWELRVCTVTIETYTRKYHKLNIELWWAHRITFIVQLLVVTNIYLYISLFVKFDSVLTKIHF